MTKLSEIKFTTVFFIHEDDDGECPMFLGFFKYDGKTSAKTEVKNLIHGNRTFLKIFKEYDDEDECIFQVVRGHVGACHYNKFISSDESNTGLVNITAGELRKKVSKKVVDPDELEDE